MQIPEELKSEGLWCVWKLNDKGKVPINAMTGEFAKSNDKSTFTNYANALAVLPEYYNINDAGEITGGLGLGIFNGFSAIDIDHCRDKDSGRLSDMAEEIIDTLNSYTEISPSGTGIRIIFKTTTPLNKQDYYINNSKIGLEIYLSDQTHKFVTITGDTLMSTNIKEVNIQGLLDKYMSKDSNKKRFDIEQYQDKKLHDLWYSQAPGSGADESERDLALCAKLAYYLEGDFIAVDSAFQSSPYYNSKDYKHRKKWHNGLYKNLTIQKAIDGLPVKKRNSYDLTDTGNAHMFANRFIDKIKYNVDNNAWMVYNGVYWQQDIFNHIKNYAEIVIEELKHKAKIEQDEERRKTMLRNVRHVAMRSGKENMLKEAEHIEGIGVTNNHFNKDDYMFNTKSGVIDLRTGKISPHARELMLSKYTPYEVSYETPKRWLKFLDEIFDNDKEIIRYVQKAMGYSMTGSTKEEIMFILLGDGSNGKSVLLETFNEALGDYGATSNVEILLERKYGSKENKGDIARLAGLRQVTTEEPSLGDKMNESAIKTMTSGSGKIVARHLYANEFEFSPKMKIWMAANYKPTIRGTDHGIWRRIRMIPFDVTFDEGKQDKDLKNKLKQEIPQILGWMLNGCLAWQKEGLKEPKKLKKAQHDYRAEMDVVQKWIDENCVEAPSATTSSKELFDNFSNYVKTNKEFQLSHTMFGRNMSKKFKKGIYMGVTKYKGIRLKPGNQSVLTDEEKEEL